MAKVADEIIVNIRVNKDQADANTRQWQQRFGSAMGTVQRDVKQTEAQIARSSGAIGGHMRTLAGALAATIGTSEIIKLADSYTILQNRLKTAGLEGAALERVQSKLYESANRNGVAVGSLGQLYSRIALVSKELGASQSQIIQVSSGVAAALKIQGTSTEEASGAMLQLGQLLGGQKAQMEEYGSLIDGLPVILQAVAAGSDRWGGSVNKLTADVKAGKVSSQDFFNAMLAGLPAIEKKAAESTQTIGQAFQTLNNQLGLYVGQTDDSLSATERLAGGIVLLSNNLDKIAPALAVLAVAFGARFAASIVSSTAAMLAQNYATALAAQNSLAHAAALNVQAAANARLTASGGAATAALKYQAATTLTAAGAARGMGAGLLALAGGPVGVAIIAIAALAAGIGFLADRYGQAGVAKRELDRITEQGQGAANKYAEAMENAASKTGKAKDEALKYAQALRIVAAEQLNVARQNAQVRINEAVAARKRAGDAQEQVNSQANNPRADFDGGAVVGQMAYAAGAAREARLAKERADEALAAFRSIEGTVKAADAGPITLAGGNSASSSEKKGKKSGADAANERERLAQEALRNARAFEDEMFRLGDAMIQAQLGRNLTAKERLALDLKALDRDQQANALENQRRLDDKEIDASQKAVLDEANNAVTNERKANRQREGLIEIRDEQLNAEKALLDLNTQLLQARSGQARSAEEARAIQRQLLDAQQKEMRDNLERRIADAPKGTLDADGLRKAMDDLIVAQDENLRLDTMGPLEAWLEQSKQTSAEVREEYEKVAVDALDKLGNSLVDVIMGTKSVGDAFKEMTASILADIAKIELRKMIVNIGSSFLGGFKGGGEIPGFATGGRFRGKGSGTSDSNVIKVSDGEFITNAKQTSKYRALLEAINQDKVPGFATGGAVDGSRLSNIGSAGPAAKGQLIQKFYVDAKGSILANDLLDEMEVVGAQQAAQSGFSAVAYQQSKNQRAAVRNRQRFV